MKRQRRKSFFVQFRRHPLCLRSAAAINDPALPLVPLQKLKQLRRFAHLGRGGQPQIRPMKAGDEHFGTLHSQCRQDVLLGPRVGGRRQGDPRHPGKHIGDPRQLTIFGPKLMPPLRDAMRLVHREQRQRNPRKPIHRAIGQQSLGGDIQQVQLPLDQVAGDRACLRRIDLGVQRSGVHPNLPKRRHLVVHQRDQWGDDHRCSWPNQGRHLVADALAPAGRHQHQCVATGDHVPHRRILLSAKPGEAEHPVQHLRGIEKHVFR